jgi:hypothetical protein
MGVIHQNEAEKPGALFMEVDLKHVPQRKKFLARRTKG